MFTRLRNILHPPSAPSVLLVVGNFGATIHVLHLVPEDSTIERYSLTIPSSKTTFCNGGAREHAREQIGTVTLHIGDGETVRNFLNDAEMRIRKLWKDLQSSNLAQTQTGNALGVTQLVAQDVLRPAALDAIHEKDRRTCSTNATETYPVFLVYVRRPRPGRILTEPTSFPQ